MEYKSSTPQVKAAGEGKATVVIATLGVKDRDGDVLLKGAFGTQVVSVVPAHDWKSPAIGKARIQEQGDEAIAEIDFYLSTDAGKNWYNAIKEDFERPPARQQYSWGFQVPPTHTHRGKHKGEDVRFLHASDSGEPLPIAEVSPVLMGAGHNTRSISVKEQESPDMQPAVVPVVEPAVETPQERPGEPTLPSIEDYKAFPEDRRPPLPVLINWIKLYRYHLPFLRDIRKRDGKEVSPETVSQFKEMIEECLEVCTLFNIKLMTSALLPNVEEEARLRQQYDGRLKELSESVNAEEIEKQRKLQADAQELARRASARSKQMRELFGQ